MATDVDSYSFRQPLGVVAGITPFNFPVMVPDVDAPGRHRDAATRSCSSRASATRRRPTSSPQLYADAGLPEGVFNVVHGDKVAVDAILDHPQIAAVSFVGSTPIARYIYERGSATGKRVQALGGAKNHAVVLPDADLDFTADQLVAAGYGSAGQRCMAISAVVAVGGAGDVLVEKVRERTERIVGRARAGPQGPRWARSSRREARDRVKGYIDGGAAAVRPSSSTAASSASRAMRTASSSARRCSTTSRRTWPSTPTRSSDPCWSVLRADTFDEAIDLDQRERLRQRHGHLHSNGEAARTFQRQVTVGMIGINVPIPVPMAFYSFGGLEGLAVRRPPHARTRGGRLLHPRQGRHEPRGRMSTTPQVPSSTSPRLTDRTTPCWQSSQAARPHVAARTRRKR